MMFGVISLLSSFAIPVKYTATSILIINQDSFKGDTTNSAVGLIGATLGFGAVDSIKSPDYAIAFLRSRQILDKMILNEPNLIRDLMAIKSFDFNHKTPIFNSKYYSVENHALKDPIPSNHDIYRNLHRYQLSIGKDLRTGFISISFQHPSPYFAKNFIELLVQTLNDTTSDSEIARSDSSINFLNEQREFYPQTELKTSISFLIEQELQKKLIASIQDDYLLKYIDPPSIPERKSSPSRAKFIVFGFFLGLVFGIFFLIRSHKIGGV